MASGNFSAKYKKQKLSSDVLAEILRSDDEDDLVEFIKKSFPSQNGLANNNKKRTRANGAKSQEELMQDVDLTDNLASQSNTVSTYDLSSNGGSIIVGEKPRKPFRICIALGLYVSFFALGVAVAILGPSLLDLGLQVNASLNKMSTVFTARSVGYLLGSLVAGWLLEHWNGYVVLAISCLIASVTLIIIPLTNSLVALIIVLICNGLALGTLDTGGNVLLLKLYGKASEAQMQCLHAMFGLGAFMAPIIVEPFLTSHGQTPTSSYTNQSNLTLISSHNTTSSNDSIAVAGSTTYLKWPFWISTLFFIIPLVIFIATAVKKRSPINQQGLKSWETLSNKDEWKAFRGFSLVLLFVFLLLYVGMEVAIGGLIFTFALKNGVLHSKSQAAYLTSTFWGSFCVGRFLCIPLAIYVRPFLLLVFDMLGCLLGALLLVLVSNNVPALLWVGTAILGASMSAIFPSTMTWADSFIHITAKSASVLVVGASLGEMTIPLAIGTLMEKKGYQVFLQAILVIVLLAMSVFIIVAILSKRQQKQDAEKFGIVYKRAAEQKGTHSRFSKGDEIVQLLEDSSEIFSAEN